MDERSKRHAAHLPIRRRAVAAGTAKQEAGAARRQEAGTAGRQRAQTLGKLERGPRQAAGAFGGRRRANWPATGGAEGGRRKLGVMETLSATGMAPLDGGGPEESPTAGRGGLGVRAAAARCASAMRLRYCLFGRPAGGLEVELGPRPRALIHPFAHPVQPWTMHWSSLHVAGRQTFATLLAPIRHPPSRDGVRDPSPLPHRRRDQRRPSPP